MTPDRYRRFHITNLFVGFSRKFQIVCVGNALTMGEHMKLEGHELIGGHLSKEKVVFETDLIGSDLVTHVPTGMKFRAFVRTGDHAHYAEMIIPTDEERPVTLEMDTYKSGG